MIALKRLFMKFYILFMSKYYKKFKNRHKNYFRHIEDSKITIKT